MVTRSLHAVESLDERMGGSVRAALDTCRSLTERGHVASLVGTTLFGEQLDYLRREYPDLPYYLFERRVPHHNFRSPGLRHWLNWNVRRFDVVEIHNLFSFVPLYTARACQRADVPYIVRPHGSLEPVDLQKHALIKRPYGMAVVRNILSRAERVLVATQQEAERLNTFGATPRVDVVPLPVYGPNVSGDRQDFRGTYGIPEDALVVLFMGRIDQKKGLQFLVPALASLKKDFPNVWFAVVGSSSNSTAVDLEALLKEHQMEDWTVRSGFLSGAAKQAAFAASDIFALPSLNENFGIAVVEALYAGVPVVLSDEVYIHGAVAKSGVGLVCKASLESCKERLRELLSSEKRRREMAERAPEAAKTHFGPHASALRLMSVYAEIVSKSSSTTEPVARVDESADT